MRVYIVVNKDGFAILDFHKFTENLKGSFSLLFTRVHNMYYDFLLAALFQNVKRL